MDYEKKYKEALERARQFSEHPLQEDSDTIVEYIFPELAESEDERIRKEIITHCKNTRCVTEEGAERIVKWITWLEKQGKEKPFDYENTNIPQRDFAPKSAMEAIKEEKVDNANKIKQKFKVGDWIISNNKQSTYQVIEVKRGIYVIRDNVDNHEYHIGIEEAEKSGRLWDISDAKDGDVLEFGDHGRLVIGILSFVNKTTGKVDVNCLLEGDKFKVGVFYNLDTVKPHPATKEQRDLLFAKMKEAGYEWDAEKKELKIKLKEPDVYEYELERIVDKLNEVIGKLGDIHQVLSKPFQFPYKDYTPPQEPWYKTHGVEKVTPVTCETTNGFNKSEDNESK